MGTKLVECKPLGEMTLEELIFRYGIPAHVISPNTQVISIEVLKAWKKDKENGK